MGMGLGATEKLLFGDLFRFKSWKSLCKIKVRLRTINVHPPTLAEWEPCWFGIALYIIVQYSWRKKGTMIWLSLSNSPIIQKYKDFMPRRKLVGGNESLTIEEGHSKAKAVSSCFVVTEIRRAYSYPENVLRLPWRSYRSKRASLQWAS